MNEGRSYRIETFDPLLRDLVVWGLVVKTEAEAGLWQLTDAAQRRLDEIAERTRPLPPDQLVYLDRLCADCRFRGRTRLCDGVYLCEECAQRRTTRVVDAEGPSPPCCPKGSLAATRQRCRWEHAARWVSHSSGCLPSERALEATTTTNASFSNAHDSHPFHRHFERAHRVCALHR